MRLVGCFLVLFVVVGCVGGVCVGIVDWGWGGGGVVVVIVGLVGSGNGGVLVDFFVIWVWYDEGFVGIFMVILVFFGMMVL